jgi:SAM-dependent methyltransferase
VTADAVSGAYRGAGESWATDAALLYVPLARHLIGRSPVPLSGKSVLDVGSGTGAVGDLLSGSRVTSVDMEADMLRHRAGVRGPAVVGDVNRLPFHAGVFAAVIGAFVLNHVPDAALALTEMGRVAQAGGVVLGSVFGEERSAAKEAVDATVQAQGWQPPGWYAEVRCRGDAVGTVDRLAESARAAGLGSVQVWHTAVDVGLDSPELVARYRLGVAHIAPFFGALPDDRQRAVFDEVVAAIAATDEPFRPVVLEVAAVAGG